MSKNDFLLVFAVSILIRVGLLAVISAHPAKFYSDMDAEDYEGIALNLIEYGVFSDDAAPPLTPNIYRTPGYPVLVALIYLITGKSAFAVILCQVIIGSVLSASMIPLTGALNLSRQVGRTAGLVLAIDPLFVLTTFQLITETVFTALLVLGFWMLAIYFKREDLRWLAGAAVLIAFASLTRPINQFLPLILLPLFLLAGKKLWSGPAWKHALMFLMVSMVITYSWAFRNYAQTNLWTLSAIGDFNLLYYRAMGVLAEEKGLSDEEARALLQQQVEDEVKTKGLDRAGEFELIRKKAMTIFSQYPLATLKIHAQGFLKVIANPGFNLICIMLKTKDFEFDSHGNMSGCSSSGENGLSGRIMGLFSQMNMAEKSVAALEILILAGLYLGAATATWKMFRDKQWFLLYALLSPVAYFLVLSAGGKAFRDFASPFFRFWLS